MQNMSTFDKNKSWELMDGTNRSIESKRDAKHARG